MDMGVNEGWGVAVLTIGNGEGDDGIAVDAAGVITGIEILVMRIASDVARVIGDLVCVPAEGQRFQMWFPVQNFRDDLDDVPDDSFDLRDHRFATEDEARQHAADVATEWASPNPWQMFAVVR